jgi:SAM-dependent methyltransferase
MSYPNFFDAGSPYLSHPLLTHERTVIETDFVLSQVDLSPGARVLDVGCGPGRHSIELAQRGFDVVGIDPSAAMINAAKARALEAGVAPTFRQVSGESFAAVDPFDLTICLFTTLGQISQQGENRGLVQRVYEALRPGGFFVVETRQRAPTVRHLQTEERFGEGEHYTDVRRRYDATTETVTEIFEVVSPSSTQRYLLRYRLYSRIELADLLEAAGFTVVASYGDYEGHPLDPDSAMMLLIGQK